jgi:ribosome maturation factor RimP
MDLRLRLSEVLEPFLAEELVELVDIQVQARGRRRVVSLLVDQPGGVTIEDCARISRRVEDLLDTEDPIPFQYVLEVSSPGLDRPLTKPSHFERFAGERVEVRMSTDFGPRRRFTGRLVGLSGDDVCVALEEGEDVRLPLDKVERARVHIDPWKPKGENA